MQCIILAGGLGTRMRPYTERIPKALIPVCGMPFLHHQVQLLRDGGVTQIVLSIGYRGDQIRNFAADGTRWGIPISYMDEGPDLRGTAGALRLALDAGLLAERFLLLYGDSYLPTPLTPVWNAACLSPSPVLMTVFRNAGQWDASNARYDGRNVVLYRKNAPDPAAIGMEHIDYGLSVFRREVIGERIQPGVKADLADVFHSLSVEGRLAGFEVADRFYEAGSRQGLEDLTDYLSQRDLPQNSFEQVTR